MMITYIKDIIKALPLEVLNLSISLLVSIIILELDNPTVLEMLQILHVMEPTLPYLTLLFPMINIRKISSLHFIPLNPLIMTKTFNFVQEKISN